MQQESPQDKFSSPPSTKSASEVLNSAQEVWEEDDIMLQVTDADTCSDQQSTDLLFVHQTYWQENLFKNMAMRFASLMPPTKPPDMHFLSSFCVSKPM